MKKFLLLVYTIISSIIVQAQNPNFSWLKGYGGVGDEQISSIAIDESGNVYSTGYFNNEVSFEPGNNSFNKQSNGGNDIFISKKDKNGNLLWVKSIGGAYSDYASQIKIDKSNNIILAGYFQDTVNFDPGSTTANLYGNSSTDMFIAKYSADGDYIWSKSIGGEYDDQIASIAIDESGNIYSTGTFYGSVDFDPGITNYTLSSSYNESYNQNLFISKLDAGGKFVWAKTLSNSNTSNAGVSVTLDKSSNFYLSGLFYDTADMDP